MAAPTFDLQSHSIHSDGALPAAEVVARAAAAGVELLALSDHDTVDGVDEAIAAGREHGVGIVPAVEISSVQDEYEDLHVLGYGIDHHDPTLLERLDTFRQDRFLRAERMADALRELGWEIDETALDERRAAGKPLGRPHLAQAAFGHPANADRLREEGLEDFSALLVAYLIPGAPAYRKRTHPTVTDAIALIHDAGGVAIWAHPFWDIEADPTVLATIDRFRGDGLDGVEVFYVTHTREQIELLDDACRERGLLTTGSSDFHGPDHRHFPRFIAHELHGRTPNLGPIAAI
jgi:hypothetical protein